MLRRKAYDRLIEWKDHGRKPLLVYGQRQVGKTYIIRKFAEENFPGYIYADLSRDGEFRSVFRDSGRDADRMILSMFTLRSSEICDPEDTLIVLDEIQDCEEALSALKVFAEDGRYRVIASGSMLGVRLNHKGEGSPAPLSPMGYTEPYVMNSLDFEEFLWSQEIPQQSIDLVRRCIHDRVPIPDPVLSRFSEIFRLFMIVGGMPASVEAFDSDRRTFRRSSDELESILVQVHRDINRYNSGMDAVKTAQCFDSIPAQLAETNKRFHYSRIDDGTAGKRRSYDRYMGNLLWIKDARYGNFVHSLNQIASPLEGQKKQDVFRVYLSDTGMLTHMYGDAAVAAVFNSDSAFNMGSVTENAVAECLMKCGYRPSYYQKTNGDSRMEIDFVIEFTGGPVAIEVKSGKDRDAPSIRKAAEHFSLFGRVMFERSNISVDEDGLIRMPLFASAFIDVMDDRPDYLK